MIKRSFVASKQIQNIVIFDLDHTITKKDTYLGFLGLFLRRNPSRLLRCWFLPVAVLMYKLKLRDNSWLKETFLTRISAGTSIHRLNLIADDFVEMTMKNGLHADASRRITKHLDEGDFLVLASASFDFYVKKIAQNLNFDLIICTAAEWDKNKRLTGKIAGKNCYGLDKRTAVDTHLAPLDFTGEITVYSDHLSDWPIFELADKAVVINPRHKLDPKLLSVITSVEHWV